MKDIINSNITDSIEKINVKVSREMIAAINQPPARFWQNPDRIATNALRFFLTLKNSIVFSLACVIVIQIFVLPVWALCPDRNDPTCPEYTGGTGNITPPSQWLKGFNPIPGLPTGDLSFFTGNFVPFVISLLVFLVIVLSLIFLLVGGISWMMAGGNKEGLAKAKGTITYALVGLILGIISIAIIKIIGQLVGGNF